VVLEGDATPLVRLGAGMAGGTLEIMGSAGDALGAAMRGGTIVVHGAAGDDAGGAAPAASRGMSGGEIVVHGSVGARAGARMRRGLVVAGGRAGEGAGAGAIAGTVIVMGDAARGAAVGSKRGTLVVMGRVEVPETFRLACEYAPPHLRFVLTYLERRHALPVGEARRVGRYRRWSGDMAELGRGEILQWTGS
jgi:formylmethanofuran dehydrogenase subunit C